MGQGGGQGGVDGGGRQRAVWEQQGVHWFHLLGSLKTNNWSDLAGDEGGEAWGVWGGGQGGVDGGEAPKSSVGATRRSLLPPFHLP